MVEAIGRRVQRENLPWVKPLLGTTTDPRLPPKLDAVLIAYGYREMDDPTRPEDIVTLFANARGRSSRRAASASSISCPAAAARDRNRKERVAPEEVIKTASAAGLSLLARETIPPFVYLLVFGKETSPMRAVAVTRR